MSQAEIGSLRVRLGIDTAEFSNGLKQAQSSAAAASTGMSRSFGGAVQNISYQVQDFAVQVASGTSATRAFAQQAPQLLSGFGVVGAVLGTVAAVAIPLAGYFLTSADAMGKLGTAIQDIGPYAAVATTALAGFYAPTLLAGLATTTAAISVGLVGAIRAVTAAMLANPLGLLVAGISAAAVAVFAFRDDVKQVFGVDFAGVIKDAANWTIDKFVKLSDTISTVWGNIGNVVGSAVIGAANIALRAVSGLVNAGIEGINKLIDAVNSLSEYTGITLGRMAEMSVTEFANPFADAAAQIGSDIGKIWAQTQIKDYVGEMSVLASKAMSKVASLFSGSTTDGKASKDKSKKPGTLDDIYGSGFGNGVESADEKFQRLWDSMEAGLPKANALTSAFQTMSSTISNSLNTGLQGLITGTMSVKEAFASMAQSIIASLAQIASELAASAALRMLLGALGGGGGAGFNIGGMVFGGLFANGGYLGSGKWGIAGEAGPEIIHGPARITPMDKMGGGEMNVTVINNTPARVNTSRSADGGLRVEIVEEMVANAVARGGNKIDDAMARGYGLRRAGR